MKKGKPVRKVKTTNVVTNEVTIYENIYECAEKIYYSSESLRTYITKKRLAGDLKLEYVDEVK